MRAVNRLRLDRRIPPRIVKHHVARVGEIQAGAGGAQTEQEHARARVALERVDDFLPVLGLAGENVRGDAARGAFLLEQFKRAGIQPTGSIASFGRNCVSSAALLAFFNKAVPSIAPTSECKGHFTKHSFRRGHVGEALAVGISLSDIMLFGNWRAAPSARNYTVGSVVSSSLASRAFRLPPSQ